MLNELIETTKAEQCGKSLRVTELTLLESLQAQRQELASRLEDLDNAIQALNENPKIATVLQLISRVRRY